MLAQRYENIIFTLSAVKNLRRTGQVRAKSKFQKPTNLKFKSIWQFWVTIIKNAQVMIRLSIFLNLNASSCDKIKDFSNRQRGLKIYLLFLLLFFFFFFFLKKKSLNHVFSHYRHLISPTNQPRNLAFFFTELNGGGKLRFSSSKSERCLNFCHFRVLIQSVRKKN